MDGIEGRASDIDATIALVRSGFVDGFGYTKTIAQEHFEKLIAEIERLRAGAAREREECAKIAETLIMSSSHGRGNNWASNTEIAAAIRARKGD
jgi:hypothetical protein